MAYRIQEFLAERLKPGCLGRRKPEPPFGDFPEPLVADSFRKSLVRGSRALTVLLPVDHIAHPPNPALPGGPVFPSLGSTVEAHQCPPCTLWNGASRREL